MGSNYFLWNDDLFIESLASKFENSVQIKSENGLTLENIDAIIILIELKWGSKFYSDFYGLEIAQKLRREHKITAPFIFCSFLPEIYFFNDERLVRKTQILKGRGSYFVQLPFTIEKLKETIKGTRPLSNASLIDVVEKCCDPIGTVIDKLHPLKSQNDIFLTENNFEYEMVQLVCSFSFYPS